MRAMRYSVNGQFLSKTEITKLYHISFSTLNSKLREFNEDSMLLSNWLNSIIDKDKQDNIKKYVPKFKGCEYYKGKLYKCVKDIYAMEGVPTYLMNRYSTYKDLGLSREYQIKEYKYCKILREKKALPASTLNGLKIGIGGLRYAIVIGNTVYRSIKVASSLLNVPDYYLNSIIQSGLNSIDIENKIKSYNSASGKEFNVTINGITYTSINSILKDYNSSYKTIWSCLEKSKSTGIPFSDVFNQHLNRFAVTYLGKQYTSDNQFCKDIGISYIALSRLKNKAEKEHRDIDEVLREYLIKTHNKCHQIRFLDKEYDSLAQLAKYYTISVFAVRSTINQLGKNPSQDKIDKTILSIIRTTLNRFYINSNKSTLNGKLNLVEFKYEYSDEKGMTYYTCVFEDGRDEILSNADLLEITGFNVSRLKEAIRYYEGR